MLCPLCNGIDVDPGLAPCFAGLRCACFVPNQAPRLRTGWQCPHCSGVHAPHVDRCTCTLTEPKDTNG